MDFNVREREREKEREREDFNDFFSFCGWINFLRKHFIYIYIYIMNLFYITL